MKNRPFSDHHKPAKSCPKTIQISPKSPSTPPFPHGWSVTTLRFFKCTSGYLGWKNTGWSGAAKGPRQKKPEKWAKNGQKTARKRPARVKWPVDLNSATFRGPRDFFLDFFGPFLTTLCNFPCEGAPRHEEFFIFHCSPGFFLIGLQETHPPQATNTPVISWRVGQN